MERFTKPDQACVLAAATAHELNNELTVILSSVASMIHDFEPDDPARLQALELQDAAQRCARKASGLLRYGLRRGGRAIRTSLERLIEDV